MEIKINKTREKKWKLTTAFRVSQSSLHAFVQGGSVKRDDEVTVEAAPETCYDEISRKYALKNGEKHKGSIYNSLARFLWLRGSSRISARVQLNAIFRWHRYARRSSCVSREGIAGKDRGWWDEHVKRNDSVITSFHSIHQSVISDFFL